MNVNYEGAYGCVDNMRTIQNSIAFEVREIKLLIQSLISSGDWSSLASDYYLNGISSLFNDCEELFIAINSYINHMNTSIDSYKDLEKQIIRKAIGEQRWHMKI